MSHRARLTPAGHATVDKSWVECQQSVWAKAQPFHHAGSISFDQRIAGGRDLPRHRDGFRFFKIQCDGTPCPVEHILGRVAGIDWTESPDADHLRAVIRQHHTGEWRGTDPRKLHDAYARKSSDAARRYATVRMLQNDSPVCVRIRQSTRRHSYGSIESYGLTIQHRVFDDVGGEHCEFRGPSQAGRVWSGLGQRFDNIGGNAVEYRRIEGARGDGADPDLATRKIACRDKCHP